MDVSKIKEALHKYFLDILTSEATSDSRQAKLAWRMKCFEAGLDYAQYIEDNFFPLRQKKVLDVACAWGGHAVAFASVGASVTGTDLNYHCYSELFNFSKANWLDIALYLADCRYLPFSDENFDVILALCLIEHIDSVETFAREIARLLKRGGLCIMMTPSRWTSIFWGEPHYQLKGLSILPFPLQGFVATRFFKRSYPFPITRQYSFASNVVKVFSDVGLKCQPVLRDGRLMRIGKRFPLLAPLVKEMFWSFFVIQKEKDTKSSSMIA